MTAKEFLQSIRNDRLAIRQLHERIEEIKLSMLPSAIRYDKIQIQSSPDPDPMLTAITEVEGYEQEIRDRMAAITEKHSKAQKLLMQVERQRERTILAIYYLDADLPSWKIVAQMVDLSTRHCIVVANNALQHLDIS